MKSFLSWIFKFKYILNTIFSESMRILAKYSLFRTRVSLFFAGISFFLARIIHYRMCWYLPVSGIASSCSFIHHPSSSMVLLSSHFSVTALFPSPQWLTQVPYENSPVPFGLSYLELDQLQKELEKNGFKPEPVGT